MPKSHATRTKVVHYVCAALLLILLFFQFTPFWHYGESGEAAASISSYIWFPTNHADLTAHLQSTVDADFVINDILITNILVLVLGAIGAVLCVVKAGEFIVSLLPAACGLSGIVGFLAHPAMRLGSSWVPQLLLCMAVLALSACSLWAEGKRTVAA